MSKKENIGANLSEDDIVGLLATLRIEPQPEANFEDRFVHDFRDRVARYAVTRPARKLLWEHILLRLTGIGKLKLACGATTLGVSALVAGLFSWPSDDAQQNRLAPTIGSAVIASADSHDQQSVVVSSSLALESSTCILPRDAFSFALESPTFNDSLLPQTEPSYSRDSLRSIRPDSVVYPAHMQHHSSQSRQITLPVIDSGTTLLPSVF